ncbi:MAG: hypothetical protein HWE33_17605 [Rhodobacteraceae bacterium]|nr:hypothetical protein [Paracoccaceae bacterium]
MDSTFWATVLGGSISLLGTVTIFQLQLNAENRRTKEKENETNTSLALSAHLKLINIRATFKAIKDYCDSNNPNYETQQPADYFLEQILPTLFVDPFTNEELALCIMTRDIGLVDRMLAIQANVRSTELAFRELNTRLLDYQYLKDEKADPTSTLTGDEGNIVFSEANNFLIQSRAAKLNAHIGAIIEDIEGELAVADTLITRHFTAMNSIKGLKLKFHR